MFSDAWWVTFCASRCVCVCETSHMVAIHQERVPYASCSPQSFPFIISSQHYTMFYIRVRRFVSISLSYDLLMWSTVLCIVFWHKNPHLAPSQKDVRAEDIASSRQCACSVYYKRCYDDYKGYRMLLKNFGNI